MTGVFCDLSVAAEIEAAEARYMSACALASRSLSVDDAFVTQVAGGCATFAGADSPFTKLVGLGFAGLPDADVIADVERIFAERGTSLQVEIATMAGAGVISWFEDRGYRIVNVENVLIAPLDDRFPAVPGAGVDILRDPDPAVCRATLVAGVADDDVDGLASHEHFAEQAIEQALRVMESVAARWYLATVDGQAVGAGSWNREGDIAQFGGAATRLAYRRRGVQSALLATRLHDAAAAGCRYAVVAVQPGSRSQANVQAAGFALAYSRLVLMNPERTPVSTRLG